MRGRFAEDGNNAEVIRRSIGKETLTDLELEINTLLATVEELKHRLDPILESEQNQKEDKILHESSMTIPPYFRSVRECTHLAQAARAQLQDLIDRIGL